MPLKIQKIRGFLGLAGTDVDALVASALSASPSSHLSEHINPQQQYHITFATKSETQALSAEQLSRITNVDTSRIHSCGIGGNTTKGVCFVVIIWAAGQVIRKSLGLPPKHFHVTLSSHDDHGMDKGVGSLFPGQFPSTPTIDLLDHLAFTLYIHSNFFAAQMRSTQLVSAFPDSHRGFLRLGDAALKTELHKTAMLSYACAFQRSEEDNIRQYCLKKLAECSKHSEWGALFGESELTQLPYEVREHLLQPWSLDLRWAISGMSLTPTLCLETRHTLAVGIPSNPSRFFKLPRFFRWLVPFHIAVMSTPRNEDDIRALESPVLGIRHVLTLTEESPLPESWFMQKSVTNTFLPIPNYHPPSIEQMDIVMKLIDDSDKLPLLIHCGGGKGRAGTVAACYLAAYGFRLPNPDQKHPEMTARDAIDSLRRIRPGSLETLQQEEFVQRWCSTIWKRQSIYPDIPCEPPPCPLEIEGELAPEARLFILCGLPGSGKSWFSSAILARESSRWTRVSQDEASLLSFPAQIVSNS